MINEIAFSIVGAVHSAEVELLKQQLNFLETAHSQVVSSYSALNSTFNVFVITLSAIVTIGGGLGVWNAIRSLKNTIQEDIQKQISQRVINRITELETALDQISILKKTQLYYYLPNFSSFSCQEYEIIRSKIPNSIFMSSNDSKLLRNSNVVILDLVNSGLDQENSEGQMIAENLVTTLPSWSTLILYTPTNRSPVFSALNTLESQRKKVEYAIANMKLTLMDRVIGAAYLSDSLKNIQK